MGDAGALALGDAMARRYQASGGSGKAPVDRSLLFPAFVKQFLRILRVLTTERGHMALVGEPKGGKNTLLHLASFAAGARLVSLNSRECKDARKLKAALLLAFETAGTHARPVCLAVTVATTAETDVIDLLASLMKGGSTLDLFTQEEMGKILAAPELQAAAGADIDRMRGLFTSNLMRFAHVVACFAVQPAHFARRGLDRVVPREMVVNLMPPWAGESLEFLAAVVTQSVAESVELHHRTVVVGEARRAVLEERLGAKGVDAWERAHGEQADDVGSEDEADDAPDGVLLGSDDMAASTGSKAVAAERAAAQLSAEEVDKEVAERLGAREQAMTELCARVRHGLPRQVSPRPSAPEMRQMSVVKMVSAGWQLPPRPGFATRATPAVALIALSNWAPQMAVLHAGMLSLGREFEESCGLNAQASAPFLASLVPCCGPDAVAGVTKPSRGPLSTIGALFGRRSTSAASRHTAASSRACT